MRCNAASNSASSSVKASDGNDRRYDSPASSRASLLLNVSSRRCVCASFPSTTRRSALRCLVADPTASSVSFSVSAAAMAAAVTEDERNDRLADDTQHDRLAHAHLDEGKGLPDVVVEVGGDAPSLLLLDESDPGKNSHAQET